MLVRSVHFLPTKSAIGPAAKGATHTILIVKDTFSFLIFLLISIKTKKCIYKPINAPNASNEPTHANSSSPGL